MQNKRYFFECVPNIFSKRTRFLPWLEDIFHLPTCRRNSAMWHWKGGGKGSVLWPCPTFVRLETSSYISPPSSTSLINFRWAIWVLPLSPPPCSSLIIPQIIAFQFVFQVSKQWIQEAPDFGEMVYTAEISIPSFYWLNPNQIVVKVCFTFR